MEGMHRIISWVATQMPVMFEEHEDQMKLENWKKVKLPYCNLFQPMTFECCRWGTIPYTLASMTTLTDM
eukprot:m51a1_g6114 hypothetical protein (69) ;mRNA; r:112128-116955